MGQNFNATNSGTGAEVDDDLLENTNTVRSSFSGASEPGSPVVGQLAMVTGGSEDILKVYGSFDGGADAWWEVSGTLHGSLNGRNNQLLNIRLENLTAETTPAAGVIGEVYLHTTAAKARLIVSATVREVFMTASNVDYIPIWIPISACERDATNPPTAATVGTTPVIRGYQFDATNEKVSFAFVVPAGFSDDANLKVRTWAYLLNAETDADTINATLDIVAVQPDNEEVPTGTSTQSVVAESVGTGNTQYSLHKFDFTLVYDDATNPINPGDLIECEFSLSSIASVTGIIVRGFQVLVPFGSKITE